MRAQGKGRVMQRAGVAGGGRPVFRRRMGQLFRPHPRVARESARGEDDAARDRDPPLGFALDVTRGARLFPGQGGIDLIGLRAPAPRA